MTALLFAFPPILPATPRMLILGTMPGVASLAAQRYYAHPQNQFWKFMGDIYGAGPALPYGERVRRLKDQGVAVWDVLRACSREGSLDVSIKNPIVNDFAALYAAYPSIERVVFDSLTAETLYKRLVLPTLAQSLRYARVPSPSPAHARLPYAAKLALWTEALKAPL